MKVCIVKNAEAENISDVFRIVSALVSDGHECVVLSRSRKSNSDSIIEKNIYFNNIPIKVFELSIKSSVGGGLKNLYSLGKYIRAVKKWLISNNDLYDVIHVFDLDAGLAALHSSKRTSKKYIYHIADFYIDSRSGIPKFLRNAIKNQEFKVINNSEVTIICTEQRKEQIAGSEPKKLYVVHNTPAVENRLPVYKNKGDVIKIAYVGGLTENRSLKEMVNVIKGDLRFELTLAGNGPLREFIEDESKKYTNIYYKGQVPYKESIEIYKECDLMFAIYNPNVPNHKYSAPNKVYEAMMLSKAIIVCKGTGVDKIVSENEIGMVCEYDETDVKSLLNKIYKDTEAITRYKINSRDAYDLYSSKEMSSRIKQIYEEIAINKR